MSATDQPSTRQPEPQGRDNPTGRSRLLWDSLDAVAGHIETTPSAAWDPAVRDLAEQVSAGLAGRLREIAVEQIIDRATPCMDPYCRYKVLVVDGVAKHIGPNGVPLPSPPILPVPADDGSVDWVAHEPSPADERQQAELREIVDRAVPCPDPHCARQVALIDGSPQHVDEAGKLLGRRHSVAVTCEDGGHRWVAHDARLALDGTTPLADSTMWMRVASCTTCDREPDPGGPGPA